MKLETISYRFAVCKLKDLSQIKLTDSFYVLTKTDDELSLICPSDSVPEGCIAVEDGFMGFRVCGTLDFSLVGILARLTAPLAEAGISIVAISTFDTDYILVRESEFGRAKEVLAAQGYEWINE